MTLIELFQALLSGQKVRNPKWDKGDYIVLRNNHIIRSNGTPLQQLSVEYSDWELCPIYLSLEDAVKAMYQGNKCISPGGQLVYYSALKDSLCCVDYTNSDFRLNFNEIQPFWQIKC